jgi:hypothetical protein
MKSLWRCAWCSQPVETPTTVNDVPFHWACLKRRMQALKEEKDAGRESKKLTTRAAIRRVR